MEQYKDILQALNETIWDSAELKFNEKVSSNAIKSLLQEEGFSIEAPLAHMETAFSATAGSGKPVIGILAEYDALSGLSQVAGEWVKKPRPETNDGHGCGHSLLGTASVGAALQVRDYLKQSGKSGTVVLLGCPAEEGGSGKTYMAREGVFDNIDVALTWHPGGGHAVMTGSMQANCQAYFRFHGISAHAAASPHLGRSALDAVELMNVGVNYLREHMESSDRIHYAITDTGGISPNVVQNYAEVLYLIRSSDTEKVKALYERVCDVARGAALMTGTQSEIKFYKACSNTVANRVLEEVIYESMCSVPMPTYTEAEIALAKRFKETLTEDNFHNDLALFAMSKAQSKKMVRHYRELPMIDFVAPYQHLDLAVPGSSDVGDCSHVVPTAQFVGACFVPGTPAHSWQMVSQGKSGFAIKGMLYAADVLATAACKIIDSPAVADQAREVFLEETDGKPYVCPIPLEIMPS